MQKLFRVILPSASIVTFVVCIAALLISGTYADPSDGEAPVIMVSEGFCYGRSLDENIHTFFVSTEFSFGSRSKLSVKDKSTGENVSFSYKKAGLPDVNSFTIEIEEKSQSGAVYEVIFEDGFLLGLRGAVSERTECEIVVPSHNRFFFRDIYYCDRDVTGCDSRRIGKDCIVLLETRGSGETTLYFLNTEGKVNARVLMVNAQDVYLWAGADDTLLVTAIVKGKYTLMKLDASGKCRFSTVLPSVYNDPDSEVLSVWETPKDIRLLHLTASGTLQADRFTKAGEVIGRTPLATRIDWLNHAFVPFESGGGLALVKAPGGFQFLSFDDILSQPVSVSAIETGLEPYIKNDTQVLAIARTGSEITVCLGDSFGPLYGTVRIIRLNPQYRLISGGEYLIDVQNLSKRFRGKAMLLAEGSGDCWLGIPGDGEASLLLQINQFNRVTDWKTLNGQTVTSMMSTEDGGVTLSVVGKVTGAFCFEPAGRETDALQTLDGDIKSLLSGVVTQNIKGLVVQLQNRYDALSPEDRTEILNYPMLTAAVEDLAVKIEPPQPESNPVGWTIFLSLLGVFLLLAALFLLNTKKILIRSPVQKFEPTDPDVSNEKLTDEAFEQILRELEGKY